MGVPIRVQSTYKLFSPYYPIGELNLGQEIIDFLEAQIEQPESLKLAVVTSYNKLATSLFLVHFISFV